jgi:hypothetical protein
VYLSEYVGGWTAAFVEAFGPAANDLRLTARLGVITVYSDRVRKSWTFRETDSPSAAAAKVKLAIGPRA